MRNQRGSALRVKADALANERGSGVPIAGGFARLVPDMAYTDDPRASFLLASFLEGRRVPAEVARALSEADPGIEYIGDVQSLTLDQLRRALAKTNVGESMKLEFLNQLRASEIFPSDVKAHSDFALRL